MYQVARLEDVYASDLGQPRATALASSEFSVISLLAAAAGLFSLLSYAVGRRRREFDIHVALGCALRTGFDLHLAKPIDPAELVLRIARLAGHGGH